MHDIGKIVFRAGGTDATHSEAGCDWLRSVWKQEAAPLLSSLLYHHADSLRHTQIPQNDIAYIAYHADNIAAAADRRSQDAEAKRFDRNLPLSPVFRHMNGSHTGHALLPKPLDGELRMPVSEELRLCAGDYQALLQGLKEGISAISVGDAWANSLVSLLEAWTSTVPSSTSLGESPDISLFDHLKITAAVGACISEYLLEQGIINYRDELLLHEDAFRKKQVYLLYSADFSGIQKFIYTVATANALRSLRSRSFFLDLVMEHYIDELLSACQLSRANLLYSGGGHCYLLLPNTEQTRVAIAEASSRINDWLIDQFGARLYLADGWAPCCGNDLTNTPAEDAPYQALFRRVSAAVAQKKLHRYSAGQLMRLNQGEARRDGRECRICGMTERLGEEQLCSWCKLFETLSRKIQTSDIIYVTKDSSIVHDFVLPPGVCYSFTDEKTARARIQQDSQLLRIYTKNSLYTGLKCSARLFVGDYAATNSMEEFSSAAVGIPRIGVCRMDVDNLGAAFVSGLEQKHASDPVERQKYVTISRTSSFSRQMSLFFRSYLNPILSGVFGRKSKLNVSIVYSGGDDVFLVGAWNDLLEAAIRVRSAFSEYTCGSLTLSAGVGVFHDHFPIRIAAEHTAELEEKAKALPGKDGVALFDNDVYPWDEFLGTVYSQMLKTLWDFFGNEDTGKGMAFLYHILNLLRESRNKINLARLAYLLAREEPAPNSRNRSAYSKFSNDVYQWALQEHTRGQLITAITIFVYLNRGKHDE